MKELQGRVTVDKQSFEFKVKLHFSQKQENLKMDPIKFYEKNSGGKIPVGNHYEMEILKIPTIDDDVELHIYPIMDKRYVCWTLQVSTIEEVKKIFKIWCLGSVYTILTKKDFANYLQLKNLSKNMEDFELFVLDKHDMWFDFE